MCGRTAQTYAAVHAAAVSLSSSSRANNNIVPSSETSRGTVSRVSTASGVVWNLVDDVAPVDEEADDTTNRDNYNLSPGMDAIVFWKDDAAGTIRMGRKVWGLVSRGGSATSSLPRGMGKHFANLMFNARSDTLFEKPTFAALATAGKTCLIAVDGFFEWKTEMGKKQPYFVYRKTPSFKDDSSGSTSEACRPYLLLAGLWTSVSTGWSDQPKLDTFTILTTEVCQPLKWLHTRMPVTVWDERLATAWLEKPSASVHRQLEQAAQQTPENLLQWHAVTPDMSSVKFRTANSVKALPKLKTVQSYFAPATAIAVGAKRKTPDRANGPAASKKAKTVSSSYDVELASNKKEDGATSFTTADTTKTKVADIRLAAALEEDACSPKRSSFAREGKSSESLGKKVKASPSRPIDSFFKIKVSEKKK